MLALRRNATVTICHSRTRDLPSVARRADVLIVAIGRKHFIDQRYVKQSAVVIDAGTNYEGESVYGDVDFEAVAPHVAAITPVPGGVGPLTTYTLLDNLVQPGRADALGWPAGSMTAPTMKPDIQIAQETELAPIEAVAAKVGLRPDELEPYGRHKAKIRASAMQSRASAPRRQADPRHRHQPDARRGGEDHHYGRPGSGAAEARAQGHHGDP